VIVSSEAGLAPDDGQGLIETKCKKFLNTVQKIFELKDIVKKRKYYSLTNDVNDHAFN